MNYRTDPRREIIKPYLLNKSVLDVGCADVRYNSLHSFVCGVAKKVVGVDFETDYESTGKKVKADVTKMNKYGSFEVVNACAIIEHLDDFKGLFKGVKKNLKKEGVLIIDTVNAYCLANRLGYKPRNDPTVHTCWFCENTMRQLCDMNGFRVERVIYHSPIYNTLQNKVYRWLCRLWPRLHQDFIVICSRK